MAGTLLRSSMSLGATYAFEDSAGYPPGTSNKTTSVSGSLAAGTGANKARYVAAKKYTIAGAGTQEVNLSSLTDPLNAAVAFTKVRALFVFLSTDTTSSGIEVGPKGATNPVAAWWSDTSDATKLVNGGGLGLFAPTVAGYAVAAGLADRFKITNLDATNSATVFVVILGE